MINKHTLYLLIILSIPVLFSACDSTESNDSRLSLSFSTGGTLKKVNSDSISLVSAKFLLKDIKIKELIATDTRVFKTGPFIVDLNMNGITTDFAVDNIPPGSYDRVKFEIHQLDAAETPPDSEFIENSIRYSGIIKGTFNSQPFVFKYKKSAKQDLKLDNPIQVFVNSSANLTITVDPNTWFYSNGQLLNPSDPANESIINENIKQSFKKLVIDNDHDGTPD